MKAILEKIHVRKEKSITAFCYSGSDFEAPWHFHPQYELTYIEESVGTKFVGDYVGLYQPGELVLLGSNLPHCWKNNIDKKTKSKSYVVHWNRDIYPKLPELELLHEMLKNSSRGMSFKEEDALILSQDIKNLSILDDDLVYAELLLLLIKLSKLKYEFLSERRFETDISREHESRISIAQEFVEANYQDKVYLRTLASKVNMTEQSFSRFFSKSMGRPFFTYLNEYRINNASRMLIDTTRSIAEIAYACGFESLPFFHKQFNKFKSTSPARYRNKYRK